MKLGEKLIFSGIVVALLGAVFGTMVSVEASQSLLGLGFLIFLVGYIIDWNE